MFPKNKSRYADDGYSFDKDGFMGWAKETFPEALKTHFAFELLSNVIDDILKTCSTKSNFLNVATEVVPEATRDEWERWM